MADWIADNTSLAHAVDAFGPRIALDTEFLRTNTYYPVPGLYQVANDREVFLIDPLAIDDWQPLVRYLEDPDTIKVMHACLEDLELLHHHLGVTPVGVFDTQFANAFVSEDFSLSYQALVERVLGVALPKHETRSNWLKRPLSDEQLQYAVEDVTYLLPLFDNLTEKLALNGRTAWFETDMYERGAYAPADPREYYKNVKKAWQLRGEQLAILRDLCAWREATAQVENVPRNRVVWDEHLYGFARIDTLTTNHVHDRLPRVVAKRYADALVAEHQSGGAEPLPGPLPRPLTSAQGALLKQLRAIAQEVAQDLGFAAELLARKRDLELCLRHYIHNDELSPLYAAWRGELVGEQFHHLLAEERSRSR